MTEEAFATVLATTRLSAAMQKSIVRRLSAEYIVQQAREDGVAVTVEQAAEAASILRAGAAQTVWLKGAGGISIKDIDDYLS